jgi:hypothetical protein
LLEELIKLIAAREFKHGKLPADLAQKLNEEQYNRLSMLMQQ